MRHFCSSLRIERFRVNAVGCGVEGFLCVEKFVQIKNRMVFNDLEGQKSLFGWQEKIIYQP
jgi:hypothetical protein